MMPRSRAQIDAPSRVRARQRPYGRGVNRLFGGTIETLEDLVPIGELCGPGKTPVL